MHTGARLLPQTSRILGMISRSQSFRKVSLSKDGSTFKISVSTSDISVLEKSPPRHIETETESSYNETDYITWCM